MPLLPLDKISPGMKTAAPVVDGSGMLLVREGAELTAEVIDRLRNRKVQSVDVLIAGTPPSGVRIAPADPVAAQAALSHAFEKVASHPVLRALFEAATERIRSGRKP